MAGNNNILCCRLQDRKHIMTFDDGLDIAMETVFIVLILAPSTFVVPRNRRTVICSRHAWLAQ